MSLSKTIVHNKYIILSFLIKSLLIRLLERWALNYVVITKNIDNRILKTENDAMVFELYGLSNEKIEIIENS